jgi:predicted DNA-binding ribbon-helix-helix protein
MKSSIAKRSIVIASHRTSVTLEEPFWKALKEIANERHMTLYKLVATIKARRRHGNLSSAIRQFVLGYYRDRAIFLARSSARRDEISDPGQLVDVVLARLPSAQ